MNLIEAFSRLKQSQVLAQFYHRWSTTERSGLPTREALNGFNEDAAPPIQKRIRGFLSALDQDEMPLKDAAHGFTPLEISFIDMGMSSGHFDAALTGLANLYDADWRAAQRIQRNSLYPMLVAFLACWIPTSPLIFFMSVWIWILIGLLLSAALFTFGGVLLLSYFAWVRGKPKWVQVRFLWVLSLTLESGMTLEEALPLAIQTASPSDLADRLRYVIPQGQPLTEILQKSGAFDPTTLTMLHTGEISGRLPSTLLQITKYLEREIL